MSLHIDISEEGIMKKCKKCGAELPEDAKFCYLCGTPTDSKKEEFVIDSDHLVTKIIIKNEEHKLLMEIPVTIGVVGVLIAPWLAALGAIAAIATRCKIIVERKE